MQFRWSVRKPIRRPAQGVGEVQASRFRIKPGPMTKSINYWSFPGGLEGGPSIAEALRHGGDDVF